MSQPSEGAGVPPNLPPSDGGELHHTPGQGLPAYHYTPPRDTTANSEPLTASTNSTEYSEITQLILDLENRDPPKTPSASRRSNDPAGLDLLATAAAALQQTDQSEDETIPDHAADISDMGTQRAIPIEPTGLMSGIPQIHRTPNHQDNTGILGVHDSPGPLSRAMSRASSRTNTPVPGEGASTSRQPSSLTFDRTVGAPRSSSLPSSTEQPLCSTILGRAIVPQNNVASTSANDAAGRLLSLLNPAVVAGAARTQTAPAAFQHPNVGPGGDNSTSADPSGSPSRSTLDSDSHSTIAHYYQTVPQEVLDAAATLMQLGLGRPATPPSRATTPRAPTMSPITPTQAYTVDVQPTSLPDPSTFPDDDNGASARRLQTYESFSTAEDFLNENIHPVDEALLAPPVHNTYTIKTVATIKCDECSVKLRAGRELYQCKTCGSQICQQCVDERLQQEATAGSKFDWQGPNKHIPFKLCYLDRRNNVHADRGAWESDHLVPNWQGEMVQTHVRLMAEERGKGRKKGGRVAAVSSGATFKRTKGTKRPQSASPPPATKKRPQEDGTAAPVFHGAAQVQGSIFSKKSGSLAKLKRIQELASQSPSSVPSVAGTPASRDNTRNAGHTGVLAGGQGVDDLPIRPVSRTSGLGGQGTAKTTDDRASVVQSRGHDRDFGGQEPRSHPDTLARRPRLDVRTGETTLDAVRRRYHGDQPQGPPGYAPGLYDGFAPNEPPDEEEEDEYGEGSGDERSDFDLDQEFELTPEGRRVYGEGHGYDINPDEQLQHILYQEGDHDTVAARGRRLPRDVGRDSAETAQDQQFAPRAGRIGHVTHGHQELRYQGQLTRQGLPDHWHAFSVPPVYFSSNTSSANTIQHPTQGNQSNRPAGNTATAYPTQTTNFNQPHHQNNSSTPPQHFPQHPLRPYIPLPSLPGTPANAHPGVYLDEPRDFIASVGTTFIEVPAGPDGTSGNISIDIGVPYHNFVHGHYPRSTQRFLDNLNNGNFNINMSNTNTGGRRGITPNTATPTATPTPAPAPTAAPPPRASAPPTIGPPARTPAEITPGNVDEWLYQERLVQRMQTTWQPWYTDADTPRNVVRPARSTIEANRLRGLAGGAGVGVGAAAGVGAPGVSSLGGVRPRAAGVGPGPRTGGLHRRQFRRTSQVINPASAGETIVIDDGDSPPSGPAAPSFAAAAVGPAGVPIRRAELLPAGPGGPAHTVRYMWVNNRYIRAHSFDVKGLNVQGEMERLGVARTGVWDDVEREEGDEQGGKGKGEEKDKEGSDKEMGEAED